MKFRKSLSHKKANRTFRRSAKVKSINIRRAPSRGGIRL